MLVIVSQVWAEGLFWWRKTKRQIHMVAVFSDIKLSVGSLNAGLQYAFRFFFIPGSQIW